MVPIPQGQGMFPISRDPPEGGTQLHSPGTVGYNKSFQFLGIPPKGELDSSVEVIFPAETIKFPISRDPPEGGTSGTQHHVLHESLVSNF